MRHNDPAFIIWYADCAECDMFEKRHSESVGYWVDHVETLRAEAVKV